MEAHYFIFPPECGRAAVIAGDPKPAELVVTSHSRGSETPAGLATVNYDKKDKTPNYG